MAVGIVSEADVGRRNADLEASTTRILRGASWKVQRIVMVMPTAKMVPADAALSWMNLIFPCNNPVARWLVKGMEVGEAYSRAFSEIVEHPTLNSWEYILTVETDNMPPNTGVLDLCRYMDEYPEFDAISGLYWTKGEGGVPQIWGDINDPTVNFRAQPPSGGLQECYGIGMGFALWRVSMFKDPEIVKNKPWFRTLCGADGVGTQDLNFWRMARTFGHRCAVANDVRVGHLEVESEIVW